MADTDPFGREKDEDPLAEMGWTSSGGPGPQSGPAEVVAAERPDQAARRRQAADRAAARLAAGSERAAARLGASRPAERAPTLAGIPGVPRRRRGGLGCAFAVLVLLFVGSVGAVVFFAVGDVVEEVDDLIPTLPAPSEQPQPSTRNPPAGLERRSLLRGENFGRALRRLERMTNAPRVRFVRLDASALLVQTATAGGQSQLARATWDGETRVVATSPGGAGTGFPWSRIDRAAPGRIVRAATRGRRTSSFDYLVLMSFQELQWSAFLRNGAGRYTAAPDGRRVRRVG